MKGCLRGTADKKGLGEEEEEEDVDLWFSCLSSQQASSGELVKTQTAGPYLQRWRFSGSRMELENLHF